MRYPLTPRPAVPRAAGRARTAAGAAPAPARAPALRRRACRRARTRPGSNRTTTAAATTSTLATVTPSPHAVRASVPMRNPWTTPSPQARVGEQVQPEPRAPAEAVPGEAGDHDDRDQVEREGAEPERQRLVGGQERDGDVEPGDRRVVVDVRVEHRRHGVREQQPAGEQRDVAVQALQREPGPAPRPDARRRQHPERRRQREHGDQDDARAAVDEPEGVACTAPRRSLRRASRRPPGRRRPRPPGGPAGRARASQPARRRPSTSAAVVAVFAATQLGAATDAVRQTGSHGAAGARVEQVVHGLVPAGVRRSQRRCVVVDVASPPRSRTTSWAGASPGASATATCHGWPRGVGAWRRRRRRRRGSPRSPRRPTGPRRSHQVGGERLADGARGRARIPPAPAPRPRGRRPTSRQAWPRAMPVSTPGSTGGTARAAGTAPPRGARRSRGRTRAPRAGRPSVGSTRPSVSCAAASAAPAPRRGAGAPAPRLRRRGWRARGRSRAGTGCRPGRRRRARARPRRVPRRATPARRRRAGRTCRGPDHEAAA